MQEIRDRGPGLRPQDKAPRFISLRPAVPLGWKSCCKQEDRRWIHIQGIQMGARARQLKFTVFISQMEAWYEWQTGQYRQSGDQVLVQETVSER